MPCLSSLVEKSQKRLRDIIIKNATLQRSKLLETATRRSPLLRSLTLLSGGELSDSLLRALSHTPNLETLQLSGNVVVTNRVARAAVVACPKLVELRLASVDHAPDSSEEVIPQRECLRVLALHGLYPFTTRECVVSGTIA